MKHQPRDEREQEERLEFIWTHVAQAGFACLANYYEPRSDKERAYFSAKEREHEEEWERELRSNAEAKQKQSLYPDDATIPW